MAKLISKTYGEALFELALEEEKEDLLMEEVEGLQKVLLENPEYGRFIHHPKVPMEEKVKTTKNIFAERISKELVGFLTLIISKGRFGELDKILTYFLECCKAHKGIGVAYVTTPYALQEEKKNQIESKLLETTSYQKMEMHYDLNPALIGGMQIRIGDRVVDSSIQTKLNQLQKSLLKVQL